MSKPKVELKTGDFVRIDWPDGSSISGTAHCANNGVVTLKFGPEGDKARWIALGFIGELHPFVQAGSLQVTDQGRLF